MRNMLGALALAISVSGCSATVVSRDDAQVVTADQLKGIAADHVLAIDLLPGGPAVRFDASKGPVDFSRVRIALASGEVKPADAILRRAGDSFRKALSLHPISFHAADLDGRLDDFDGRGTDTSGLNCPSPSRGPKVCCVCGTNGDLCDVFVCFDTEPMRRP